MSWSEFLKLSGKVNCVTKSLNRSKCLCLCLMHEYEDVIKRASSCKMKTKVLFVVFSWRFSDFQDSNLMSWCLCLSYQSCQSLQAPPVLSVMPSITMDPNLTFGPVMTAVSDFKGLLQEVCQGGFVSIYEKGRELWVDIRVFIWHKWLSHLCWCDFFLSFFLL